MKRRRVGAVADASEHDPPREGDRATHDAERWGLDARLVSRLRELEIDTFFPIQRAALPRVLRAADPGLASVPCRDICVSAPTGSGKTLIFVLGVLHGLAARRVPRLRALVVLPTRDLAIQVHGEFERYAATSGLRIGLAVGRESLADEQRALVGCASAGVDVVGAAVPPPPSSSSSFSSSRRSLRDGVSPLNHSSSVIAVADPLRGFLGWGGGEAAANSARQLEAAGGHSCVDVLVCTPGRLVEHLEGTHGFTLQHLRFLVVDEADRLLSQPYQNWVEKVYAAAFVAPAVPLTALARAPLTPTTARIWPSAHNAGASGESSATPLALRRLLFSATLTDSPQQLALLKLTNPEFFSLQRTPHTAADSDSGRPSGDNIANESRDHDDNGEGKHHDHGEENGGVAKPQATEGFQFQLPLGLQESYICCAPDQKPLVLLALIAEARACGEGFSKRPTDTDKTGAPEAVMSERGTSIVFVSSVESAKRLARLVALASAAAGGWVASGTGSSDSHGVPAVAVSSVEPSLVGVVVAEYSSSLSHHRRSELLDQCRRGIVNVLVCSDGMARGIDLPNVDLVVNYDAPTHAKTYVHRVGRTARAGRSGDAVTILKIGQDRNFQAMRLGINDRVVGAFPLEPKGLVALIPVFTEALAALKRDTETGERSDRTGLPAMRR